MDIFKKISDYLKRRILTSIALTSYYLIWFYIFWSFHDIETPEESCGAANGGLIVLMLLISGLYFIITITLTLTSHGQKRKDFKIAFFLTLIGFFIGYITSIS